MEHRLQIQEEISMIKPRRVVIAILGAALSGAPFIRAQVVQPSRSVAIQELGLQPETVLAGLSLRAGSIPSSVRTPDLSRYRGFQLGMTLPEVAKQTDTEKSEVTVIHERPVLIQELEWRPLPSTDSSTPPDPVESVKFTFYSGELFRVAVNYDEDRTAGLTEADLIKGISATYGAATLPAGKPTLVFLDHTVIAAGKVVARWESPEYSISLVRSANDSSFGLLLLSKALNAMARTASVEGTRIEAREAPQRELARQKQQADDDRAARAKVQQVNQAGFRP
jgi:hypothetical protein